MKIVIDGANKIPVTAGRIGLFFEDVNYGLDGGLYAEMLENRNFEAKDVTGERNRYTVTPDGLYGWSAYPAGAPVALKIKTDRALYAENPHYLRMTVQKGGAGIRNKSYDGVYMTRGMKYKLSFYLRSYDYKGKAVTGVYLGGRKVAKKKFKIKADGKWHRFSFVLKASCDAEEADFTFCLSGEGTVHLDCFSLMPQNAVLGLFRRDLARLLKEMKPGFLRFPGGCVVEGNTLKNRYLWKLSVGQREKRIQNWNRWAVHAANPETGFRTEFSHYGQTLGVGCYEYFLLSEYLGAKPLPVVGVGLACQYMSDERFAIDSAEFESCIQDALDLIEFAVGASDSEWGSVRAEMGHPSPFDLEYLGIGNEQWETEDNEFYRRYEIFARRIHEKYPAIKLIGTAGPTVDSDSYRSAWAWMREKVKTDPDFVYAADEHFYAAPDWMYAHTDMYDNYPRDIKVLAGEYAAHAPGHGCALFNRMDANLWEGALAEAAFMTGMERNADVVAMASYAPLLARYGYAQWSPDLIWFDGSRVVPTVNYYVQQLYSLYTGTAALKTTVEEGEKIYVSATEREGLTYIKVVNSGEDSVETQICGDYDFGVLTRIICMEGDPAFYNSFEEPKKIIPYEIAPEAPRSLTLPAHSFTVLVFRR